MPLDPVELASTQSPRNTPPFIDENPNRDLIEEGMELAEEERRETAGEVIGEDPSLTVDDDGENEDEIAPEIRAIHIDRSVEGS